MKINKTVRRIAATAVGAAVVLGATNGTALGADATDVTVTGGSLSITTAPTAGDFAGVTLDGTAKTDAASFDNFEVNDARGSGVGWNVTMQATQFAEHNGTAYVASGKTLPTSSLSLANATAAADGSTSTAPSMTAGAYALDSGTAVKIASAAADAGMGKYDISFAVGNDLTLSVPASAYAKTYRSDVTVTLASTP